ncbi:XK-related protein 6 [Stomoxys calcitrans]|uniref:XK-related protein n=1 Tax=Stomoxys calcitrans TaxID=35570 RepID=A0A1I8PN38_STOCA|nr:XK-related protein 6 [Stomoxys calcitrans]
MIQIPSTPPPSNKESYSAGTSNTISSNSNDIIETPTELSSLQQCKHLMQQQYHLPPQLGAVAAPNHKWRMDIDPMDSASGLTQCTISYMEICSTALSIIMRAATVCINVKLAVDYQRQGRQDYFIWTVVCIVAPMITTMLIHANMCYQDGKFSNCGCGQIFQTVFLVIVSSFFFRYWKSFVYAIKCKKAQLVGDKQSQLKNYKLNIREESDVAFIRLFECFLEAAPQKILLISIVLSYSDKMTNAQVIAIASYFGSMAWCLSVYHRYARYSQSDKYNISANGVVLQLCWHFCISVSRTLCISFVASVFPLWTLIACFGHALVFGLATFIMDRPKFSRSSLCNFLFCLVLGIVYIFTYISVRDAPTRYKYLLYYVFCSMENVICIAIFTMNASADLVSVAYLFYPLCAVALSFYYIGIVFMFIYYLYFHPRITARKSKRIINNN